MLYDAIIANEVNLERQSVTSHRCFNIQMSQCSSSCVRLRNRKKSCLRFSFFSVYSDLRCLCQSITGVFSSWSPSVRQYRRMLEIRHFLEVQSMDNKPVGQHLKQEESNIHKHAHSPCVLEQLMSFKHVIAVLFYFFSIKDLMTHFYTHYHNTFVYTVYKASFNFILFHCNSQLIIITTD